MVNNFITSYFSSGVPLHLDESDSGYDGGNIGLNYTIPKPVPFPIDNTPVHSDVSMIPMEIGFLDNLFPCLNACQAKTGQAAKDCLNACRGKGITASKRKEIEAMNASEIADALKQITADTSAPPPASNNTLLYVVIILVVLILLGVGGYFLLRKKPVVA